MNTQKPVLKSGAVYFGDNGRTICSKCAGASALYSGRDLSGSKVVRADVAEVAYWEDNVEEPFACEGGCTTLSRISAADGWPTTKEGS